MNELLFSSGTYYEYPLIIKKILTSALRYAPSRTISYRDRLTYTYTTLEERIKRLAGALSALGMEKGDVVGMIDYNSHRFLETYFAVPMMGAVLATFNWRQGIAELGHTISHASPRVLIVHEDFLCLLKKVKDSLGNVHHLVLIKESEQPEEPFFSFTGEYEDLLIQLSRNMSLKTSTKTPPPRSTTPRARPVCPRVCRSPTGRSFCIRSPWG